VLAGAEPVERMRRGTVIAMVVGGVVLVGAGAATTFLLLGGAG
jgi:hypothetical protein